MTQENKISEWENKLRVAYNLKYTGILPDDMVSKSAEWLIEFIRPYIRKEKQRTRKETIEEIAADWNCHCENPKPDNNWEVGEHEGRYQRCKKCDRRIWD